MPASQDSRKDDLRYNGDHYADVYDSWYDGRLDTDSAVTFLADLVPSGRALELGVGTGRIAIPLAARGLAVTGVDNSPAMLARLALKTNGQRVAGVLTDMAEPSVRGPFELVYVAFSSLFLLPDQAAQLRCLRAAGGLLAAGGVLVVEAFVPDATRYDRHQSVSVEDLGATSARIEVAEHDPAAQTIRATRVRFGPGGVELFPYRLRYATPAELDLMAQLAGLTMRDRFGGFDRSPFDRDSTLHVTVYDRSGGAAA